MKQYFGDGFYFAEFDNKEQLDFFAVTLGFGPHKTTINPLFFNMWSYKGDGQDTDIGKEGGLYLSADTQYTEEQHDIWIDWGMDILKALSEAGI